MHTNIIYRIGLLLVFVLVACQQRSVVQFEQIIEDERLGMILVPAGEFIMGSSEGKFVERPERRVYLDAFRIDQNPVTNRQYHRFWIAADGGDSVNHTPQSYGVLTFKWPDAASKHAKKPVVGVSWEDAFAYAQWAGKRLPTEAEWEKAARGADGRVYPWGNDPPDYNGLYRANYLNSGDPFLSTSYVGFYNGFNKNTAVGDSPYGINDMAGNVWQWVNDWYDPRYYRNGPLVNPPGPPFGTPSGHKIVRGGSWLDDPDELYSYRRQSYNKEFKDRNIGFRCVKDVP